MRKSTLYLTFMATCLIVMILLPAVHPLIGSVRRERAMQDKRQLVGKLQLTDLCLFTEARYTRHLSQADLYSAFQDHPMSFEHFPSGSLTLPPVMLRGKKEEPQDTE